MKFIAPVGPGGPKTSRRARRRLVGLGVAAVMTLAVTSAPGLPGVPAVGNSVQSVSDTVAQASAPLTRVVTPVTSSVPVVPEVVDPVESTAKAVVDIVARTGAAGAGGGTTPSASAPSASTPKASSGSEAKTTTTPTQPAASDAAPSTTTPTPTPAAPTTPRRIGVVGATPAATAPLPAPSSADPETTQPRRPANIMVWIVEVTPPWAQALIAGLMLGMLGLALASYRRLRRRAADDRHRSLHDPLTDLPNRTLFASRLDEALSTAAEQGVRLAVMLIDLDDFKEVNDTLGHRKGDELLQRVAGRLAHAVREEDTVARLGGDEFAVLIPRVAGGPEALEIAGSLRQALEIPFSLAGLTVQSDASIGIALSPDHASSTDALIQRADVAMYLAKGDRTGAAVYDPARDHYGPERLALIGELRQAIECEELTLHYQPQIEPRTGRVRGVEALIRWNHPTRGLVTPEEFIPLAERTGLIAPLTRWVIGAAVRQCATWRSAGLDLWVAANLSAANLTDGETPAVLEELLRRWKLPPGAFRLEITETTAMADPARTREVLARLDGLGVELAIDDFGTGYSSLSHLKRLPVHELKIDRSFVSKMATDHDDEAIVTATIEMAHSLGLRVVAEGVEDVATLEELRRRRCDLAQGYLFSKPLPAKDLEEWLRGLRRRTAAPGVGAGEPAQPQLALA